MVDVNEAVVERPRISPSQLEALLAQAAPSSEIIENQMDVGPHATVEDIAEGKFNLFYFLSHHLQSPSLWRLCESIVLVFAIFCAMISRDSA